MTQFTKKEQVRYAGLTATEFMRADNVKCKWCSGIMRPDFLDNTAVAIFDKKDKELSKAHIKGARGFFCDDCTNCETV